VSEPASLEIGDLAPPLELPDTEGRLTTLPFPGEAPATVVVWTCNHCPYALAWHDRLLDVARDHADRGVRFLAVNSNDAERHPADSLEAMRERVAREDWPHPYLRDESQEAALAWGPLTTPDVFVLDSDLRLRYRGAPDADHDDPSQEAAWLRAALDAVLTGGAPEPAETKPVGCSIKWKP
jgi:peroxiredoxin